jgi:hypothetical protein
LEGRPLCRPKNKWDGTEPAPPTQVRAKLLLAVGDLFVNNSAMMKRALLGIAGLLGLCAPAFAQFPLFDASFLDRSAITSPWVSLDTQDRFAFSTAFGSMRANQEFLPALTPATPLNAAYALPSDNKNSVDRLVDLRAPSDIRFGGEIGFLYGKSTGSNGFGREDYAGYIIGTVGNDKFSITAGYYRQETNFSGPRWRR